MGYGNEREGLVVFHLGTWMPDCRQTPLYQVVRVVCPCVACLIELALHEWYLNTTFCWCGPVSVMFMD